jgi:phage gpG-like protein
MRVTLDLEKALLELARQRGAETGKTLSAVVESALREALEPNGRPAQRPFEFRWVTVKAKARPGVDINDREQLHDVMDGKARSR